MKQIEFGRSCFGYQRAKASCNRFAKMLAVLLAMVALPTFGSTITVTNVNDSGPGSLRAALASAASGDLINFALTYPATIVVASSLQPGNGVSIAGPGPNSLAIDGGDGVSVFVVLAEDVVINGLTIQHGSAVAGAGVLNEGTLTLVNVAITNNTIGTQLGAGIFNAGTLTLLSSTVSGNSASSVSESNQGGGIYNFQGMLTIDSSTVSSNGADAGGGGIFVDSGTILVKHSTISGNTAGLGGGIYVKNGTATFVQSTISGNGLSQAGAGILSGGDTVVDIENSTIASNVGIAGAGIVAEGALRISFSTLAANQGIGIFTSGTTDIKGSLFAGNSGGNCFFGGTDFSRLYNVSDDGTCASVFNQQGDLNSTSAGLDSAGLHDNGGATRTIALSASSPAINAIPVIACTDIDGQPVAVDQRGVTRPQGSGCDVGAYEYFQSLHLVQAVGTYQIIDAVFALSLPTDSQSSLTTPLKGAVDSLNQGNLPSARGQLGAFINQANALVRSRRLTSAAASPLIAAAQSVFNSIAN